MVQRKPVSKPGIQVEANTSCFKSEWQQLFDACKLESKSKAGCDPKKKMKKGRSFKHSSMESSSKKAPPSKSSTGSSPNYMKPTSSSDAKKESLQVSLKSRTYAVSSTSKKSETSSKFKDVAGYKPSKSLSRSSSLRPVRPSMKKSCVVALYPKHNVGRPTCSSTLKDAKFPAYLDLHHGGTEVEGTSVVKVCPYTYCSLNGHFHEPLPPLKCFLAEKRRLLKAQKCLKLKGVPEIETKVCRGSVKEVDQPIQEESAMLVDEGVDFFVEIYAKPKEERDIPLDFNQSSDQSCEMICEGLYQEEFDHNCEEHGEESEEQVLENFLELLQSDMEEMGSNYYVCSDQEDWDEKFNYYPASESEETNPIMSYDDQGEEVEQMLEEDAESCSVEFNGDCDSVFDIVWIDEKEDQSVEEAFDGQKGEDTAKEHALIANIPEHNSNPDAAVELLPSEQDDHSLNQEEMEQDIKEEQSILMPQDNTEPAMIDQAEETSAPLESIASPQEAITIVYSDQDPLPSIEQAPESVSEVAIHPEKQDETEQPAIEEQSNLMQQNNTEPAMIDQVEETNAPLEDIVSPREAITIENSDQDPLPGIEQAPKSESEVAIHPEKQDETEQPTIEEEPTMENKGKIYRDKECYERKTRQAGVEDADMDKEFNPRPPNFLPLEPDPDAEKVDLKHQMMEERKNAEEWMLDYALRSTVNKLGPARKRRVALLVEAFESVMPVHKCESRLPAAASCFTHTMHLQACN